MKRKPIVGETLFSLNVGNDARHGVPQILTPMVVKSVGKKYFKLSRPESNWTVEFYLEDWSQKTEFCAIC